MEETRKFVLMSRPENLQAALQAALHVESVTNSKRYDCKTVRAAVVDNRPDEEEEYQSAVVKKQPVKDVLSVILREIRKLGNQKRQVICYNCQKPGHLKFDCPEPRKEEKATRSLNSK